jgi:hypothetical protein
VFLIVKKFWQDKKENTRTGYSTHVKLSLFLIAPITGVIFSGILVTGVSIGGIKSRILIQIPNGTAFSWDLERSETNSNRMNLTK